MSNNVSIVKVIDAIIDKKIDATTKKTTSNIVLFKSGSTLTPNVISRVSF